MATKKTSKKPAKKTAKKPTKHKKFGDSGVRQ